MKSSFDNEGNPRGTVQCYYHAMQLNLHKYSNTSKTAIAMYFPLVGYYFVRNIYRKLALSSALPLFLPLHFYNCKVCSVEISLLSVLYKYLCLN